MFCIIFVQTKRNEGLHFVPRSSMHRLRGCRTVRAALIKASILLLVKNADVTPLLCAFMSTDALKTYVAVWSLWVYGPSETNRKNVLI